MSAQTPDVQLLCCPMSTEAIVVMSPKYLLVYKLLFGLTIKTLLIHSCASSTFVE